MCAHFIKRAYAGKKKKKKVKRSFFVGNTATLDMGVCLGSLLSPLFPWASYLILFLSCVKSKHTS